MAKTSKPAPVQVSVEGQVYEGTFTVTGDLLMVRAFGKSKGTQLGMTGLKAPRDLAEFLLLEMVDEHLREKKGCLPCAGHGNPSHKFFDANTWIFNKIVGSLTLLCVLKYAGNSPMRGFGGTLSNVDQSIHAAPIS